MRRKATAWLATSMLLALPTLAVPADEAREGIPITDPVLLESLGFEPDAANVHATPQALEDLLMDPAERAVGERARHAVGLDAELASPFGTEAIGYSSSNGADFDPLLSTTVYGNSGISRYCLGGLAFFDTYFKTIPHGAALEFVDVWFWDVNPDENLTLVLWQACLPEDGPGGTELTSLGIVESVGVSGDGYRLIGDGHIADVDLRRCSYLARVRLAGLESSEDCTAAESLSITRVRAQWRRQVSPAPPTATFDDVPASHPFFQHIEALAASGITAGCGANDFCPSAPLTRGQMAVFLAKALGLHWGSF